MCLDNNIFSLLSLKTPHMNDNGMINPMKTSSSCRDLCSKIYLDKIIERFSIFPLEFTLNFQHINLAAGDHDPDQHLVTSSLALQADTHLEL